MRAEQPKSVFQLGAIGTSAKWRSRSLAQFFLTGPVRSRGKISTASGRRADSIGPTSASVRPQAKTPSA